MKLEIGHKHLPLIILEPLSKIMLPWQKRLSQLKKNKKQLMLLLSLIFILLPLVKPELLKIKLLKPELVKSQGKFHIPEILGVGN
jgi:hypothetical protein